MDSNECLHGLQLYQHHFFNHKVCHVFTDDLRLIHHAERRLLLKSDLRSCKFHGECVFINFL